jgi:predicted aminopeptidase
MNNASLAALAAYDQFVPAFTALLARHAGDLAGFYAAAQSLADASPADRLARLQALGREALSAPAGAPRGCRPA